MIPELQSINRFVRDVKFGDGAPRPVIGISLLGEGLSIVRRPVTDKRLEYLRPFRQLQEANEECRMKNGNEEWRDGEGDGSWPVTNATSESAFRGERKAAGSS